MSRLYFIVAAFAASLLLWSIVLPGAAPINQVMQAFLLVFNLYAGFSSRKRERETKELQGKVHNLFALSEKMEDVLKTLANLESGSAEAHLHQSKYSELSKQFNDALSSAVRKT